MEGKKPIGHSQTVPLWIYTCVLHILTGFIFVFVANPDFSFSHLVRGSQITVPIEDYLGDQASVQNIKIPGIPSSLNLIFWIGLGHVLAGLLCLVVTISSFTLFPKLVALIKFLAILQSLLCIGTTVAVETVIGRYHETREFYYARKLGSTAQMPNSYSSIEHKTVVENAGYIVLASSLTLAILSLVAFTAGVKPRTIVPLVYLLFPLVILTATVAGTLIFSTSSIQLIILGSAWALSSAIVDFIGSLEEYIGILVTGIISSILFGVLGVFGGTVSYFFYTWISQGRKFDTYNTTEIAGLTSYQKVTYKFYYLLGERGSFLLQALFQTICITIFALCSAVYIIYDAKYQKESQANGETPTKAPSKAPTKASIKSVSSSDKES